MSRARRGWAIAPRVLRRLQLNRVRDLKPKLPLQRYEHARPNDRLHLDLKKLGRTVQPPHRVTANRRNSGYGAS